MNVYTRISGLNESHEHNDTMKKDVSTEERTNNGSNMKENSSMNDKKHKARVLFSKQQRIVRYVSRIYMYLDDRYSHFGWLFKNAQQNILYNKNYKDTKYDNPF